MPRRPQPYQPLRRFAFLLVATLLGASTAQAQRNLTEVPQPDIDRELRSFQLAEGFEVNLFAADPMLAKPIQMNWDAQGRLWVACSETYPQIEPGKPANDKIIILEDRNGDGRADHAQVFADGLLIPTGVEPGDGGAYVAGSTQLLHLKDTDGDGKADKRTVVLSGFGTEDTHHILHTFRWGPDGCLYFNQSIYIHSHIETPHGVRRLGGGGIWRFEPDTLKLDVLVKGFVNPWGHRFDRYGAQFATDGAYSEGINFLFPGATYVSSPGARRIVKGLNPGSPKHCGLELISGRHFPEEWQGNAITADFRGHRVCRFVLSEDGSGFASREQQELIKSTHVAFRPVDIAMGPDGALYIADWYNPIIQHGEVDFRDDRRDRRHGRIWRITYKGRPLVQPPRLVGVPTSQLLDSLRSPEEWTRQQARRLLRERGAEILPDVQQWVASLDRRDPAYDDYRLEALWLHQALRHVEPELLTQLARSDNPQVRAAAAHVLSDWQDKVGRSLELFAELVNDEHPRVRLEAVSGLAASRDPRAVELAMQALDHPVDRFIDYALWNTARTLEPIWVAALKRGEISFDGRVSHLTFALEAAGSPGVIEPLMNLLREGKIPSQQQAGVLALVAALGSGQELQTVFELALTDELSVGARAQLLDALADEALQRKAKPQRRLAEVVNLLKDEEQPEAFRAAAARAAGAWRVAESSQVLAALASGQQTSAELRQAALESLRRLNPQESASICRSIVRSNQYPHEVQAMAVASLAEVDPQAAAQSAVEVMSGEPGEEAINHIFSAFLTKKSGPEALQQALASARLPADVAKLGLRLVRSTGQSHDALVEALKTAGNITSGPVQLSPEEMKAMVDAVLAQGDPARGEVIFRRKDQLCFKCHAIGGAGGRVGPDLVSLGASAQVDYLIDSLLNPNKAVKENYHSLVVATDEGRIYTGIKVRQTDRELILRDAEDRDIAIPLASIEQQAPGGSLMPAGLSDNLTRGELIDLVRFLSELGKVDSQYSISQARYVRRYQVVEPTREAIQLLRRTSFQNMTGNHPEIQWTARYSTVAGTLPLADIPSLTDPNRSGSFGFVRMEFSVSTAGKAILKWNSTAGLTAWLDGVPLNLADEAEVDFTRGRRRLVLAVNMDQRKEPIQCELIDVPGSPAQVQIVSGN